MEKPSVLLIISVCNEEDRNKVLKVIQAHDHVGIRIAHIMPTKLNSELLIFPNFFDRSFYDEMTILKNQKACMINSIPIEEPRWFRRSFKINNDNITEVVKVLGPITGNGLKAFVDFLTSL